MGRSLQEYLPCPDASVIDFKKMLLGVFIGMRPTICYSGTIETIETIEQIRNQRILVKYRQQKDSPYRQAITHPMHLISL